MPRQSDERSRPDGDNAAEAPRSPVRSSRSACSIYFTENSDTHLAGNFLQASGAFFDCSDGLRLACLQAIEMFRHATDSAEPDFAGRDVDLSLHLTAQHMGVSVVSPCVIRARSILVGVCVPTRSWRRKESWNRGCSLNRYRSSPMIPRMNRRNPDGVFSR